MTELRLFPGELSEKRSFSVPQQNRIKAVTIAAMKQCGRLNLPHITFSPPLHKWTPSDMVYPAYFEDIYPEAPKWSPIWQKAEAISFLSAQKPVLVKQNKPISML